MDSTHPAVTGAERLVDVETVTWAPRRKGWMGRPPARARVEPAKETPVQAVGEQTTLIVPAFPSFSPVSIAALLNINRGTVHYYLESGKLGFFRDNVGERYVLRDELVRFIRKYLLKDVLS